MTEVENMEVIKYLDEWPLNGSKYCKQTNKSLIINHKNEQITDVKQW